MFTLTPIAILAKSTAPGQKALLSSGLGAAPARALFSSDLCSRIM